MWSDDVKAEAIARCSDNKDFIMEDGDLSTARFPDDPEFPVPTLSRLEAMCDVVQKEWRAIPKKPTIEEQLEYLWHDINNNSLNKGGTFYKLMRPHLHK